MGLGNILRLFSAESVKLSGWMGAVGGQTFSGLSTDVRLSLSQGSGWAAHGFYGVVAKLLLQRLSH